MSNYIVDCRYVRTTTPVGIPDFTVMVEAKSHEHAMLEAEKTADAYGDFTAVGACETLALVKLLRDQVLSLAQFGDEMANKGTRSDYEEFQALLKKHNIAYSGDVPGDCEETDNEEHEEDPWYLEHISDQRKRAAKLAFEKYDFEAYGGVARVVGWFGISNEEHALIRLGGCSEPEHVFVVEFDEDREDKIVHIGIEPFENTAWRRIHHFDGAIVKYNLPTS